VSRKLKAAEDQSLNICIKRENLEHFKAKIAEHTSILSDLALTIKKMDENLMGLNKNR
jgi:hypothetical protein